jgi:zinc protease
MKVRFFTTKIAFLTLFLLASVPALTCAQQPRKESLLNGLKVLMFPDPGSDKVWVRIRIHSGSAFDPAGKEGVMQMLAANFFPTDAAKEYFSDELGGSLTITANYDYIQVDSSAKPDNLIPMLETLAGGIVNTVIDKDTTAKLRSEMLAKVKTLDTDTANFADRAAARRLFGTFPYGRPQYGTEESIRKIDLTDLQDAKSRFLTGDNATMAISGNFQPTRAMQAVKRYFGGWTKSDRRVPATFRQPEDPPAGVMTIASPVAGQFAIRFALRGTSRSAADMAAADVFARIVEARLKARVPAADIANVFARSEAHMLPGWIVIGFSGAKNDIGSGNGKIDANELVSKALRDPVTDAEFNAARSAAANEWARRSPEQFWLDVDTYTLTPQSGDRVFDSLTAARVRDFAAWVTRQPIATVLVNSPK